MFHLENISLENAYLEIWKRPIGENKVASKLRGITNTAFLW